MKNKILAALFSFGLSLFIIIGPTVFLANLLIYYSYLYWTITGLIIMLILFISFVSKFYNLLMKNETITNKYLIKQGIIMFIILFIVLSIIYPRIF